MKILLVVKSLHLGGAEIFVKRLSEGLYKNGHNVVLLNLAYASNKGFVLPANEFKSEVKLIDLSTHFVIKIFNFFPDFILKFLNPIADHYRRYWVQKIASNYNIDVINSHLMAADTLIANCLPAECGFVITMHGSYESNLTLNPARRVYTLNKADAIIYIAEKNLKYLKLLENFTKPLYKIYNGYEVPLIESKIKRSDFGIEDSDIVFVMAARGDKRKGWELAIKAFLMLRRFSKNIHLLLIAGGDYIESLKSIYGQEIGLIFTNYTNVPQQYFRIADVGLLPSTFPGESLPNSVVEYLAEGLAVIASDIGEIRNMISTEDESLAGEVLAIKNEQIELNDLFNAMQGYIISSAKLIKHKQMALLAYDKFKMDKCANLYSEVFEKVILKNMKK